MDEEKESKRTQIFRWVIHQQESRHREQHAQLGKDDPRPTTTHGGESIAVDQWTKHKFADDPWKHTCRNQRQFLVIVHRTVVHEECDKSRGDEKPWDSLSEIQGTNGTKPGRSALLHVDGHGGWFGERSVILYPSNE